MNHAIIISGNGLRFRTESDALRQYLTEHTDTRIIGVIRTADVREDRALSRLERAFERRTKTPLLVLYIGHGSTEGWGFDDERMLHYWELAESLQYWNRPITIINDTCHAMSLARALERMHASGASMAHVSLYGACGEGETTRSGLIHRIIGAWRCGTISDAPHWGADNDDPFFAKRFRQAAAAP